MNYYSIREKIKESAKLYRDPGMYFESEILKDCPNELHALYPGKLYVFRYHPKYKDKNAKPLYDSKPYIMSLGPKKDDPYRFFGINMHIIPYNIRVQILESIYNNFGNVIDKEIEKFPSPSEATKQAYINQISTDTIKNASFDADISQCIHAYSIKYIQDCKLVNYNLIHFMLLSETNYFVNGSIFDAQEKFLTHMQNQK